MNDFAHTNYFMKQFSEADKLKGAQLFRLYKKAKRIMSREEVGGEIFSDQFLLLAHDADIKHRFYYHQLIKDTVRNNVCSQALELNFILRTEMFQKGQEEFRRTLEARLQELSAAYHLPDYSSGVF